MLRFGIVGCGGVSHVHARCLAILQQDGVARLVAGAEVIPARAAQWSAKYGVPVHGSLDELLDRTDIDVVTVTTPSGLHGEMCVRIAESGRHVLCEKPLDLKVEKVDAAIAAAERHRVVLGGIFQQRFAPGPIKVKRAIEAGKFGQIVFVHCETPWYRTQSYYDSADWRGSWALDGGVLFNQSPHMIDRLLWLGGDLDCVLSATLACGFHRDIEAETLAVATIRLNNGALGTITGTTLAYDGLPQRVLICGTEGSAAFSGDDLTFFKVSDSVEVADNDGFCGGGRQAADPLALSTRCHAANIRDFVMAVQERRTPLVSAQDQRKVVRCINAIYHASGGSPCN